jgi:metallothionein
MTETKKCAHPACSCAVTGENTYCSQSCEDAAEMTEISCNCGHPGCELELNPVGAGSPSLAL